MLWIDLQVLRGEGRQIQRKLICGFFKKPGIVVNTLNPSVQEEEAILIYIDLHSRPGYIERCCLKNDVERKRIEN